MEKKQRGGKREGAGRKTTIPEQDKKSALFIYPMNKDIEFLGGKDEVKAMCEAYITNSVKRRKRAV